MRRWILLGTGFVFLGAGAVLAPAPVPIGVPMMVFGSILLARQSRTARGVIRGLRARWPDRTASLFRIRAGFPRAVRYLLIVTDPKRTRPPHGRNRDMQD